MKVIAIDPSKFEVGEEYEVYEGLVDGLYYRTTSGDYLNAGFCFPVENKPHLQVLMDRLRNEHKRYKEAEAHILYTELPKLRKV